MKKPANDILDTCKINPAKFVVFEMPKLNKNYCLYFLSKVAMVFALFLFTSFDPGHNLSFGLTKVVIDAGHGGHDSGCLGKKTKEKDVALGIALKLGKYIEDNFTDVKVIYTRTTDKFVELYERADIANNAKADLFICIHCNSACYFDKKKKKEMCNTEIAGVETWVMGLNKSDQNLEVAKRENEVILLEKDYTRQYGGFDPNSPEANIIFTLYQNTFLDKSLRIASYVQQEMKSIRRPGRGVKQAGFLVLYKTSMPSILIETGFLSNANEEKYLSSAKGQDEIARGIYRAFRSYKNSVEAQKGDSGSSLPGSSEVNTDSNDKRPDSPETSKVNEEKRFGTFKTNSDSGIVTTKETVNENSPVNSSRQSGHGKATNSSPGTSNVPVSDEVLQWSVQFYTSPKPLPDNHKIYSEFNDVREDFDKSIYKYSTGLMSEKSEAIKLQTKLRQQGYKDAFVIAFLNNKRISAKEATEKSLKK